MFHAGPRPDSGGSSKFVLTNAKRAGTNATGNGHGDERAIFTSVCACCNIALVKPFELLGRTVSPDGSEMKLIRRDEEYLILVDGVVLMSNRMHGSEEALATFACRPVGTLERPSVLIGGLGMGFTLRAALDLLPSDATVVVAELAPVVVE